MLPVASDRKYGGALRARARRGVLAGALGGVSCRMRTPGWVGATVLIVLAFVLCP
jgi:hypothetical protein